MIDGIRQAGDVTVDDITIVTSQGHAQTITPQVVGINLYEDIFSSFITGQLIVEDCQDLQALLPLMGEESVRLAFHTPSLDDKDGYSGEYVIYKMEDRVQTQGRQAVYILHFISPEAVVDLNTKLSRTFRGRPHEIAYRLIKDDFGLGTDRPANIEECQNQTAFIANFWSPTRCLQYACENAVNVNGSPSYIFFENKYGFNFVTLDSLNNNPIKHTFRWSNYSADIQPTGGSRRDWQKDYEAVMEIHQPLVFDYIQRLKSGMYGSEIIYRDLVTQQYVHNAYASRWGDQNHLNPTPLWTTKVQAKPQAKLIRATQYYNNFDGLGAEPANTKTIQKRICSLATAEASKLVIKVHGRTDYSAGQKVFLEIPKAAQLTKDDPEWINTLMSGNYLIAAVMHDIDRSKHSCTMELIKDSYLSTNNEV